MTIEVKPVILDGEPLLISKEGSLYRPIKIATVPFKIGEFSADGILVGIGQLPMDRFTHPKYSVAGIKFDFHGVEMMAMEYVTVSKVHVRLA